MEMLIKKFNSIARSIAKLASFPKVKEEKYNNYFKKIINDLIDNPKSSLEDISAALLVGLIPKVEMVDVKGGILPESSNYPGKKVKNFKVSKSPITLEEWKTVANWAKNIGFKISSGDASDSKKPVNNFTKQDAIHWCNAKSIMDELAPAYTTEGFTNFSKNHPSNKTSKDSSLIPNANGYRLLSELEQEYVSNKHPKGLRLAINTKNNSTDSFEGTFVLPSFLKSRLIAGLLIILALPCFYLTFKIAAKNPQFWSLPLAGTYYAFSNFYDLREVSRLAGENRVVVPFDKVSNVFYNALISHEDSRFYKHHGIDFFNSSGTITQKLIKQTYNLSDSICDNLIRDFLALRIERELTKEHILEAYVNRIYFGSDSHGIEAASETYFGKPASKLNLPESATLAGLIRNPNRFSPLNNPDESLRERNTVLRRMRDLGFITTFSYDNALAYPALTASPKAIRAADSKNWPVYEAGRIPKGRLIATFDLADIAKKGTGGERIYLRGGFNVTVSGTDCAIMNVDNIRFIVQYPNGMTAPAEGSFVWRDSQRPFQVMDVKESPGGQINVYVREVTKP
jgi:hypothetical protein